MLVIMIALTEYIYIMSRKEKIMGEMIEGAGRMRKGGKREKEKGNGGFQRDKEDIVREILRFHGQKMDEERVRQQEASIGRDDELYLHLDRKLHVQPEQAEMAKQQQTPLHVQRQHFNEYIELSKQTKPTNTIKLLTKYQPQSYQVIDNFLKNKENVMLLQENSIKAGKGDMKSINQSTMAISKFYKPQLSPQSRKMRKTQSKPNANSKSKEKISQRRQENQEYQSCIFSLSDNEASKTYNSRNDNTLSNYEQVKKVSINLNLPKEKIKTSLMEIQEFQELFDCNYQEEKQESQEKGLMEYLKNRISKGKNKPQQKPSSQSSSSCSFLLGKEKVTEMGISKVNNIVEQAVKNVAFNLQKQKNGNEDNRVLVHQNSEQDLSSNFFANLQSQPSTVQKFDDKSHDKSEMLRHLQDLKECSASLFNQKPVQQYLLEDLNSSHLSQHFQNLQAESCKNIEIDLQNMIESHKEEGTSHEESSVQPSMNSFKMEVSMDKQADRNKNKGKRIEIDLSMSCSGYYQADNTNKEVVNLDELSNYESDEEEQAVQKHSKPKAKIILKGNNTQKHFIDGLKNDISALKNKISASFISQESQLSFTKTPIQQSNLHPHQVYNQLKSNFSNLKRRMQQDAGLHP